MDGHGWPQYKASVVNDVMSNGWVNDLVKGVVEQYSACELYQPMK